MVVLDADLATTDLTPVEVDGGIRFSPAPRPEHEPCDLLTLLHPQVPLTNNVAERILRAPAIGRGLSFGSNSEDGAEFTAIMYSVVGTLSMNGIDVLRWLEAWLAVCAENGRQPPDDLSAWLPWSMSEERRLKFTAPG